MPENAMKATILIPVATLSLYAMQVYAAGDTGTSTTDSSSNAAMAAESVGGTTDGTTGADASVGKTRNQVYQELIRARRDGSLDRINQLYNGG
jgi:hypothetical protein